MGQLTALSREVEANLMQFHKELDAKLHKIKGNDSTAFLKAYETACDLRDEYESMGQELSCKDDSGRIYDLSDFSVGQSGGVVWQWKARE